MTAPVIPYRPDIDGLRAVAIIAVVAFHTSSNVVTGGFVGVDIFFVISGYLISGIIFNLLLQDRFSFRDFYFHRARRIFPALGLVLAACLLVGWFVLFADEYQQLGKHTSAGALFVSNFVYWKEAGYFDTESDLKPLLHLWSLGIEEQFYILWPVILVAVWKWNRRLLVAILVFAALSFAIGEFLVSRQAKAAFYLPVARAWELMLGSALAYRQRFGMPAPLRNFKPIIFRRVGTPGSWQKWPDFLSLVGAVLVLTAVVGFDKYHAFPGWRALVPTFGTALLIAAGRDAIVNRVVLSSRPMVMVGLISYPLYLWHWPLLSFARIMESGNPTPEIRWVAVMLSVIFAYFTYAFIERPIRMRSAASQAPTLFGLVLALATLGFLVARNDGIPARVLEYQERLDEVKWALESEEECQSAIPVKSRYCRISDANRLPTAVIIGDSHANRLFDGLNEQFRRNEGNLLQLGEGGCLPFWDVEGGAAGEPDSCSKRMNGQLDYIVKSPTIKTVFLAGRGPLYISGAGFGEIEKNTRTFLRYSREPNELNFGNVYSHALRDTISKLLKANKRIVFVIDNPELGFNPLACLNSRPVQLTNMVKKPCAVSRDEVDRRNREYRSRVNKVAQEFPKVLFLDTHQALCDEQYCWAMNDGKLLYMDGDHLNNFGARLIGEKIPPDFLR